MFAVSSYTKDVNRSMEIITALNTDPELRTILQYGVEDKHWKVNDENPDVIDVISDDYKMNILETGNVYMTYPAAGVSKDVWEYSKTQNLASQVSPYYGFDIANYDTTVIDEYLVQLEQYSKEIYDRIEAMSAQEFSDGLSALRKEVNANEVILRLLSQEDAVSLYSFYFDFFTDNGGSLED
jgi:putative aldouronate transport system substrate-binding protein